MLRAAVKINYYDDAIVVALCALRYIFLLHNNPTKSEMARKENVFHLTKLCFALILLLLYGGANPGGQVNQK